MEVLDIGIERPAILPPTIVMKMLFTMMKLLKCTWVIEDMEIGILTPKNIPLSIVEFIILVEMLDMDIGLNIPSNLPLKTVEFIILVIKVVTILYVDIDIKRPAALPLTIVEQEWMLKGKVDIGLITVTLPPITQVAVLDY